MLGFSRAVLRHGTVEVAKHDGAMVAASLVLPPGAFPMPVRGKLTTAAAVLRSRPGRTHRFARAEHELHKQHLRGLHYYLWFLGVDPEHQGRGFGSELLRSLTAKADSDKMPCYLETDRERNVGLYRRHGFEVLGQSVVAGMDAQMWFMRRPVERSGRWPIG
jgi:ribosomal protein S18 acetylase RimI-like enzyme